MDVVDVHLALEGIDLDVQVGVVRFFDQGALQQERLFLQFPQLGHQGPQLVLDLLDGALALVAVGRRQLQLEAKSLQPPVSFTNVIVIN